MINIISSRNNRTLFFELARANILQRDYHTFFGHFWSLLNPLFTFSVLFFIFQRRFGSSVENFPIYLFCGVMLIGFFTSTTAILAPVLHSQKGLILNSRVPREIIILSTFSSQLIKFFIEIFLCAVLACIFSDFYWSHSVLLIPLILAFFLLTLGIGFILSIIFCFARDISHIWGIASRLLYFVTPIFYKLESLSTWASNLVYWANPLSPFFISFRDFFIRPEQFNYSTYFHALGIGSVYFITGHLLFKKFEDLSATQV